MSPSHQMNELCNNQQLNTLADGRTQAIEGAGGTQIKGKVAGKLNVKGTM